MNLVIDIGNSSIKCGLFEEDKIQEKKTFDDFEELQEYVNAKKVTKVLVSTVKYTDSTIKSKVKLPVEPAFLSIDTRLPFVSTYQSKTLGLDRIAAVAGAHQLFPNCDVLVIDAGTSITYEILRSTGRYAGGAISLGLSMRFKALNNFTERLPLISQTIESTFPAKTTEMAIHSGVTVGILAEIEAFIEAAKTENSDLKVILTGGDSKYFESKIKERIFAIPELVLMGLNAILRYNAAD